MGSGSLLGAAAQAVTASSAKSTATASSPARVISRTGSPPGNCFFPPGLLIGCLLFLAARRMATAIYGTRLAQRHGLSLTYCRCSRDPACGVGREYPAC